jgi:hypothetical protein
VKLFSAAQGNPLVSSAKRLEICRSTVQEVSHSRLKLQAYKIQAMQQALRPDDRLCRKEFYVEMLVRIGNDSGFLGSHF